MGIEVNQELVNNRAKLMMHRLAARRLSEDPTLAARAEQALDGAMARDPDRDTHDAWRALLRSSVPDLRRSLTRRDETMERLRLVSPFMVLPEIGLQGPDLRRRIWRLAKRGAPRTPGPVHAAPAGLGA